MALSLDNIFGETNTTPSSTGSSGGLSLDNIFGSSSVSKNVEKPVHNSTISDAVSKIANVFNAKGFNKPKISTDAFSFNPLNSKSKKMDFPVIKVPDSVSIDNQVKDLDLLKKNIDPTSKEDIDFYNSKVSDLNKNIQQYQSQSKLAKGAQDVLGKEYTPTPYDTPGKLLSHDLSQILNEPIKGAGEALGSTKVFQNLAEKSDAGEFAPAFTESLAQHLQFGMDALAGATGGLIRPEYQGDPNDFSSKLVSILSQGVGMATTLGGLETGIGLSAPKALLSNFKSYPKVQQLFNGLARSVPAFAAYGQLNPELDDIGSRLKTLGKDVLTAIPYTALGLFNSKALIVPASAALGFGMAKLSGADNKDALISATALGLLSLAGGKEKQSKEVVTQAQAKGQLYDEALNTINKYSELKISKDSSPEEIKRAYKEAALKTHPDRGGNEKDFSAATYAKDILLGESKSTESIMKEKAQKEREEELRKTATEVKRQQDLRKEAEQPAFNAKPKTIPKELQPLAEEARKYKTPEEFVKVKTDYGPIDKKNSIVQDYLDGIRGKNSNFLNKVGINPKEISSQGAFSNNRLRPEYILQNGKSVSETLSDIHTQSKEEPKFNTEARKTLPERPVEPERVTEYKDRLKLKGGDPVLVDAIITPSGNRAYGVSVGGRISLEGVVEHLTEDHEVFHQVFQNMEKMRLFKRFDKSELMAEAKDIYGDLSESELEEEMAKDFQQYVNEQENGKSSSFFGKIKEFFDRLFASIKRLFKTESDIKEFYRTMREERATEETVINDNMPESFNQKVKEGVLDFRIQNDVANFLEEVPIAEAFTDSGDLTLKTITKLEGRTTVSKQYISDLTNSGDIKQVERDLIRSVLEGYPDDAKIPVAQFVQDVKVQLLPLTVSGDIAKGETLSRYESVTLPAEIRGNVADYTEKIYESPIKTSAGNVHFGDSPMGDEGGIENYFGHTRIEDMADSLEDSFSSQTKAFSGENKNYGNGIRRVIEVQSDLYQKGNLEKETEPSFSDVEYASKGKMETKMEARDRLKEINEDKIKKLFQYNDPTAHFRMVREEIKKAAQDGKIRLQFPTGETAMKIEGLGQGPTTWMNENMTPLEPEKLKIGEEISNYTVNERPGVKWIVTDVLGDGKFKAVPKDGVYSDNTQFGRPDLTKKLPNGDTYSTMNEEQFDISGKVDTNNPIYRFYEKDLGRYLKNNYDAKPVTDDQGVTWMEVSVNKNYADLPVPAFNTKPNVDQLRRQLDRVQQSLDAAVAQPQAHAMAYGPGKVAEYKEKIASLKARIKEAKFPTIDTGNKIEDLKKILAHAEERVGVKTQKEQVGTAIDTIKSKGLLSETELQQILKPTAIEKEKRMRSIPESKIPLSPELENMRSEIDGLNDIIERQEEILSEHPGKTLQRLNSRKEGQFLDPKNPDMLDSKTGEFKYSPAERQKIIKENKKIERVSSWAFEGTEKSDEFDNPDIIRESIDAYQEAKTYIQSLKDQRISKKKEFYKARNEFFLAERDRFAIQSIVKKEERLKTLQEVEKILRKEGQSRKQKIESIKEYFHITPSELKEAVGDKDYRLLSDKDFDILLKNIEEEAYQVAEHSKAVAEVEYTINQKNLRNTEAFQEAMGLSRNLKSLATEQLDKLNQLLGFFEDDDVFLGVREIQTLAKNTDLPEVKTQRQIIRALFPDISIEKLKATQATFLQYMKSATALSQEDPFKQYMVTYLRELINKEEIEYLTVEKEVNELAKKARESRKRSALNRLVPTDDLIKEYLEEPDPEVKVTIAKGMTPEELEFAHYLQEGWREKRDYLIKQQVLGNYIENYVTHRKRGFLEAWLKSESTGKFDWLKNFGRAVKETFWDAYKLDQTSFNILDTKTGTILPLEKWFRYAQHRSGNLIPTKNMATAYLGYEKTFGRKKVLDMYMPKIEAVSRALSPTETTEHGVVMNDDLVEFAKEFINTQKGRPMAFGKVLRPGNGLDIGLRLGVAFIRVRALAFNLSSNITSPFGEQYATYIQIGLKKYATGIRRSMTKQGKAIVKNYEGIIGETVWAKLKKQSVDIGSKIGELGFAGFGIAARRANINHLLGEMTPEEFASGEIAPKRLAEIKNDMSRWRMDEQLSGIVAKTSVGGVMRQFKSWAIPILGQYYRNIKSMIRILKEEGTKETFKSKEFKENYRATIPALAIFALLYKMYKELQNNKDKTFIETIEYKAMQEITTSLSAIAPSTVITTPALLDFLTRMALNIQAVITSLSTGERTASGHINGSEELKKQITPALITQLFGNNGKQNQLEDDLNKKISAAQKKIEGFDSSIVDKVEPIVEKANTMEIDSDERNNYLDENFPDTAQGNSEFKVYEAFQAKKQAEDNLALVDKILPIVEKANAMEVNSDERNNYLDDTFPDTVQGNREFAAYESIKNSLYGKNNQKDTSLGEWDKQGFITHISNIAKAIGTDPVTAFQDIFSGDWRIVGLKNGQVIVQRMSEQDSQAVKKARGGNTTEFKLDHAVPLEIGGNNSENNLQLIPTDEWEENSPVENYLGKLLGEGKITGKKAREYIIRFKAGKGEILSATLQKEYKKKYNSEPLTFEQIKNL